MTSWDALNSRYHWNLTLPNESQVKVANISPTLSQWRWWNAQDSGTQLGKKYIEATMRKSAKFHNFWPGDTRGCYRVPLEWIKSKNLNKKTCNHRGCPQPPLLCLQKPSVVVTTKSRRWQYDGSIYVTTPKKKKGRNNTEYISANNKPASL